VNVLKPTFRHGIHPREHKEATEHLPIVRMPFVERYVLPLSQHTGAPCKPVVKAGDRVVRGQVVAEPGAYVSQTLHAPVTGTVVGVGPRSHPAGKLSPAIEIEADPFSTQEIVPQRLSPVEGGTAPEDLSTDEFVGEIQRAGLVGMGGAAFPSHVKYKPPKDKEVTRLVVNGCECEPFLTSDHRTMVERPEAILRGADIVARQLGVNEVVIGVELNKPDAIEILGKAIEERYQGEGVGNDGRPVPKVVPLRVKYPQGAEKMLIRAIYGEEVPSGGLPLDVGAVVNNVGTMAAVADWFDRGIPLIERVVTVAGPGVERPANMLVPVGTPVRAVLDQCGLDHETREVVMGGPMMGQPLASLDVPVLKGTSGLLAFTETDTRMPREYSCIKCGRCVEACPQLLNPSRLAKLARAGRWDELEAYSVMDCVECGSCSYSCPSGIPIVQLIRVSKSNLREQAVKAKREQAEKAKAAEAAEAAREKAS